MLKSSTKFLITAALAVSLTLMGACVAPERKVELQGSTPTLPTPRRAEQQPSIVASPVEETADGWKVANADAVTLTVTAPGASEVEMLYRPVIADETDGYVRLKNLIEPTDRADGKFQTNVQTSSDFAGQVWAQVKYPDGTRKQTEQLALTTRTALGETQETNSAQSTGESPENTADATQRNADSNESKVAIREDESARADKATGGKIVRVALRPNNPDIRITVNVPAFLLTLWQDGKEVAIYPVGVGRKAFPIPVGDREANRIILNPAWIPPDSSWVRESSSVEPYERIPADDSRNPLGKIEIPLGDAYLMLNANDVDASRLDDATLKEMIERTSSTEKFVVKVSDIKRGRAAQAGRTESLVAELPPNQHSPFSPSDKASYVQC